MTFDAISALSSGQPWPLGSTLSTPEGEAGVNFAVWAPDAEAVELCLFDVELCLFDKDGLTETARYTLPGMSDGVWHGFLPGAAVGQVYGYRVHGPWAPEQGHRFNANKLLLDPWATAVVGSYGQQSPIAPDDVLKSQLATFNGADSVNPFLLDNADTGVNAPKARVTDTSSSSTNHQRPRIPYDKTVVYEAHVRSLTILHPDIPEDIRGSYAALAHPVIIDHLKSLGITTLELLPVHFRADERRLQEMGLSNHWGYSSIAFFAPETRYWSGRENTTPESELRDAISTLHAHNIEVVLDVVYNHTAEADELGPTLSFRGLANRYYYHLQKANPAQYENWTGCGNCLNLAEPRVVELVIGSLRHWAEHYGVDGFRFDLAPTLARGAKGEFRRDTGFLSALQADPLLSTLKLIAEPWDIGPGGYRLGGFPTGWREWNDRYRDYMRGWWLKNHGNPGAFAHYFAGTAGTFHHSARGLCSSVNFITAHDGFNLEDVVSYEHKHNKANGEDNRDGHGHNNSHNFGVEGQTDDPDIIARRQRMKRNLQTTLVLSQGIPMLLSGDEIGHSQQGNNNAYCQDNEISWLDWNSADQAMLAFHRHLVQLRRDCSALRQRQWLTSPDQADEQWTVQWLTVNGETMTGRDWNDASNNALLIHLRNGDSEALVMINHTANEQVFTLPDGQWLPALDTEHTNGRPTSPPGPITKKRAVNDCSIQVLVSV